MSGHNWKPGDVARVTPRGGDSMTALRVPNGWSFETGWASFLGDDDIEDARPLVVIDPEDREQVERLDDLLWATRTAGEATDDLQAALREFAAPTPPRIKEPDVWGIVRAGCVHSDQVRTWMRHEDGNWYVVGTDTKNNPDDWDSLTNPVLVREGVAQ